MDTESHNKIESLMLIALLITALGYVGVTLKAQEEQQVEQQAEQQVEQVEPLFVNVLMYFDEEYCEQDWNRGSRDLIFYHLFESEPNVPNLHDKFINYYNIRFVPLNAWMSPEIHFETWASNNSIMLHYDLLQDAIRTHGGVWDADHHYYYLPQYPYWKDGKYYLADLTLFFTGQVESGGVSPPEWNAAILSQVSFVSEGTLMHELSHQWWVEHCGNWCCMNPPISFIVEDWCDTCKNFLFQHREEFGYKAWLYFDVALSSPNGSGTIDPPANTLWQKRIGTWMTITAYPAPYFIFKNWWFCYGMTMLNVTDNPKRFPITHNWDIYAVFQTEPEWLVEHRGGGGGTPCFPK